MDVCHRPHTQGLPAVHFSAPPSGDKHPPNYSKTSGNSRQAFLTVSLLTSVMHLRIVSGRFPPVSSVLPYCQH
jgi:hypothetical protein